MAAGSLEIVLMRQLASYLAVPILVVDRHLDLVFFNESAEPILGRRFDETGGIRRDEWSSLFRIFDPRGEDIPAEERPLVIAIDQRRPSHRRFGLTGLDGAERDIEGIAFPLETEAAGLVGAVGIFWEVSAPRAHASLATETSTRAPSSRLDVEAILLRRLAGRLRMPLLMADPDGRLVYCNAAAEPLLGGPLARLGGMSLPEWYDAFQPTDEDGSPIKREDHPLNVARTRLQPCHRRFFFRALDGARRGIEGTAFPRVGQCNRHLGAVGIFWEDAR
jgi:PAS domain-containing protein